jgi:hypothetical protein
MIFNKYNILKTLKKIGIHTALGLGLALGFILVWNNNIFIFNNHIINFFSHPFLSLKINPVKNNPLNNLGF